MASKRKSTVPCMIPSKSKHVREEIKLGLLPEVLPTIPEDSILSISGKESGHISYCYSKSEMACETRKGGTYSCVSCQLESRDLNYFLDHMHNCHSDFTAEPTFYCLNCGVAVVRFEALALHNAKAHPKIMEGLVTASLSVCKRDGLSTVEQNLFTDSAEECRESGISLTKTPIAKMMKGKGEHKKIVVSHTVEVRKIDNGKDIDPSMLTNVPEFQNGALGISGAPAMPRTAVTPMITKTVSNQVFHQHTPSLFSPPSSDSNKDLPKVMIPLSSIPTYDAAMDTSSFLKTSFGKFPYPTKAELCYLTVVSEFPEEQIKLWFTAQRLKQGISWSPEEIEEARRKMFNTVFQGGAPQKQPATLRQVNHIVTHHTVAAHPGSKGPNIQMAKLAYDSIKSRHGGDIATQASILTNPHITRVSYSTPAVPPQFPLVVRTTTVPTKSSESTVESDRSNGLDVAGGAACVSSTSSSSISNHSSSSNGVEMVTTKPPPNSNPTNSIATCSISNNKHCAPDITGNPNVKSNGSPTRLEASISSTSHVIINTTSKPNHMCNNHNAVAISVQDDNVPNQNHASKAENTSSTVVTKSISPDLEEGKSNKDFPMKGISILQQLIKDEDPSVGYRNCSEHEVDPIKINFKRMAMNELEGLSEIAHHEHKSDSEVSACHQFFSPPWGSKTPEQLHVLRQAFSNTRWPSSLQYEELSIQTGLPKSEVVHWFSDSRYSHKNGQLKWLETYQRLPAESEDVRGRGDVEGESPKDPPTVTKTLQDVIKQHEGEAGLKSGQRQDSYSPLVALSGAEEGSDRAGESGMLGVLQDPWSESLEDHQRPEAHQTLIQQQTDANQARNGLRMELLEV